MKVITTTTSSILHQSQNKYLLLKYTKFCEVSVIEFFINQILTMLTFIWKTKIFLLKRLSEGETEKKRYKEGQSKQQNQEKAKIGSLIQTNE